MAVERHLSWDGCFNVRDLGGLPTADGRETRWGAVVRSERPYRLTAAGWAALRSHGIRTIIDLQDDEGRETDSEPRPAELATVHVPLEQDLAETDPEFKEWGTRGILGTPLYYGTFLHRWPERCAAAVAAVAHARPGGVLIHCGHGRDRTGLVVMLLLALVGVSSEDIAADYELSAARLRPFCAQLGHGDESSTIATILARENTSARTAILATVVSLDVDACLRAGGLSDDDLAAVRASRRMADAGSMRAGGTLHRSATIVPCVPRVTSRGRWSSARTR